MLLSIQQIQGYLVKFTSSNNKFFQHHFHSLETQPYVHCDLLASKISTDDFCPSAGEDSFEVLIVCVSCRPVSKGVKKKLREVDLPALKHAVTVSIDYQCVSIDFFLVYKLFLCTCMKLCSLLATISESSQPCSVRFSSSHSTLMPSNCTRTSMARLG